ncbi:MAG TPA: hypothetical protein DCZ91_12000 [Lachnospiraceae bacterium]|nr:hypothetical protein [Lachnospiraceae bacterium]
MSLRARVYNIMQYEKHPTTGEVLLTEETIKQALSHDSIMQWAYIRHDKDVYSEKDEKDDPSHKQGYYKPPHWHICLRMKTNCTELPTIAKWFGIKENYIDMPKGRSAFLDCVKYLTHADVKQQEQGKHRYPDAEVKSDFDWKAELERRDERKAKYGKKGDSMTDKQVMGQRIMLDGLTLLQAKAEDPVLYADCLEFFKRMRGAYLADSKPPKTRLNYYICGDAGAGKGVMSRALARALFPDLKEDEEIFFEVGAEGALFEGYDGQPVLIWNDRRAGNLIKELGGRSNVYNVFDTHPTKQKQNVKYASVGLVNAVNIVNSIQPYVEFLETLAGVNKEKEDAANEYAQKSQSYRRFPLIINVHPEEFDIYVNKGFLSQNETYLDYEAHKNFYANMRRIAETCSRYEGLRRDIEGKAVQPVLEQHERIKGSVRLETDEEEMTLDKALVLSGMGLDCRKKPEVVEQRRMKHERAVQYRQQQEAIRQYEEAMENPLIRMEYEEWKKENHQDAGIFPEWQVYQIFDDWYMKTYHGC